uniref:Uncharacterized protein n=1 Tax=Graphocephala atropunctata TaxID=36148 RepID=A0A1B6KN83_9HEMI
MARFNVLRINVCYSQRAVAEYCLFACDSSKDFYCGISSFEICPCTANNKLSTPARPSLYWREGLNSCIFEQSHADKAVLTKLVNKSFCVSFNGHEKCCVTCLFHLKPHTANTKVLKMDGYGLSLFLHCLYLSHKYIELVTNHLSSKYSNLSMLQNKGSKIYLHQSELQINLTDPDKHIMDMTWARMACKTVYELCQLQYAMSWLSTLGGAFSALGEGQERCAKTAGMISVEQLRLAVRLGDDVIIAQCKLYFSLSLIQRGQCKRAKLIIQEQFINMKRRLVVDRKTVNMCKGIWARLKYEHNKQRRPKVIASS